MQAFKTYIKIENPREILLRDLPFASGQLVEVLIVAQDEGQKQRTEALRTLFRETQSMPHLHALSEDEIAAEIEQQRNR